MSVKRYDMEKEYSLDINVIPVEENDGEFVKYEDYAALEAKCAALAAEVYDLKHPGTYLPSKHETPALDAFLAEVRAQGVEMFAIEWGGHDSPYGQDAYNFADKIRKGVQS